jgi:hypothetical protein
MERVQMVDSLTGQKAWIEANSLGVGDRNRKRRKT